MAPKRSKDTKEAPEPISEMDITNAILEQSQARFDPESLAILQEKLHNVRTLFEKYGALYYHALIWPRLLIDMQKSQKGRTAKYCS